MNVFFFSLIVLLIYMTAIFGLALWLKDNSIVDVAYGLAFVLTCNSAFLVYGDGHARQWLIVSLITIWGLRLTCHIFLRKQGEGEDFRYRQWRQEWGDTFIWRSFLQIFMLQGTVIFLVVLPALLVIKSPGGRLGVFDLAGLLVWLFGFGFEAIGDWQLFRFKRKAENRGKIIQSGLWRYTRHPNYFGLLLIALKVPYGAVAVLSPLLIDFLLLKVSGIPMLEAKYQSNPEFTAYKARTNALFPWLPKPGGLHE